MADFFASDPEKEEFSLDVVAKIPVDGKMVEQRFSINNFVEYEFNSNFLTPTDGFSFTVEGSTLTNEQRLSIRPGSEVTLSLNGIVQACGYIDSLTVGADRSGGTVFCIEGRDKLAQAIDSCADPTRTFKSGETLAGVLSELFAPFGWGSADAFVLDNDANRDARSNVLGQRRSNGSASTSRRRRRTKRKAKKLTSYQLHQLKPYPREGVHEFASRITQRQGLWIWPSADGRKLIVSRPDFDQVPLYELRRSHDGTSNVLSGDVKIDNTDQPTIIVADGFSGGGDFGRSPMKAYAVNTAVYTDDPEFLNIEKRVPGAVRIKTYSFASPVYIPKNRVLYLHDNDSQTPEHLEFFLRRELALLQRRGLTAHYTVRGHGQNTPDGYVPWSIDTTVDVFDDVAWFKDTLYVVGRTFRKSRSTGTTTTLELIRLHSIDFGGEENEGDETPRDDSSSEGDF